MSIREITVDGGRVELAAQAELTIYQVRDARRQLAGYLDGASELLIDLSAVREFDGAGVQLLMHMKLECARRNIAMRLIGHSQAVVDVFELLNLGEHFGDPMVLTASGNES